MWQTLWTLIPVTPSPWLMAGDFNEVLYAYEKVGGRPKSQRCMDAFRGVLEECGMDDLGYKGDMFTWRNNQFTGEDFIKERLDRAMCNGEWRQMFPEARVINGDPRHSDHRPVIIHTCVDEEEQPLGRVQRSFRFEVAWLEEERCREIVKEVWKDSVGEKGG